MPPIENKSTSSSYLIYIVVVIVLSALVYWAYSTGLFMKNDQGDSLLDETTETSLGGEIYNNSVNPLEGALPETPDTVVNPLEDSYKNPFQ